MKTVRFLHPGPSTTTIYQYPAYVANELGYFADEGLVIDSNFLGESLPVPVYVQNGDAEVAGASADQVLQGIAQGADYKVYYDSYQKNFDIISATPASGVSSVQDLAGMRVGYAENDDLTMLHTALNFAGVDPNSVDVVKVGRQGPIVLDQLKSGNLDAYASGYSDFSAVRSQGVELKDITPEEFSTRPSVSMVVLPSLVENDRELVVGFLRAWSKATYAGYINRDMLTQMAKSANPDEHWDDTQSKASIDTAAEIMNPADGQYGAFRPEGWVSAEEELLAANELIRSVPLDQVLDDSLLEEVNNWDRSEVEADANEWMKENGA